MIKMKTAICVALLVAAWVPVSAKEKDASLSFEKAEKDWGAARGVYIDRLKTVLSNLNEKIKSLEERLDGGDRRVRDSVNEELRDLHRARDEAITRLSMMQLVTVVNLSDLPKDIAGFFKDVSD